MIFKRIKGQPLVPCGYYWPHLAVTLRNLRKGLDSSGYMKDSRVHPRASFNSGLAVAYRLDEKTELWARRKLSTSEFETLRKKNVLVKFSDDQVSGIRQRVTRLQIPARLFPEFGPLMAKLDTGDQILDFGLGSDCFGDMSRPSLERLNVELYDREPELNFCFVGSTDLHSVATPEQVAAFKALVLEQYEKQLGGREPNQNFVAAVESF